MIQRQWARQVWPAIISYASSYVSGPMFQPTPALQFDRKKPGNASTALRRQQVEVSTSWAPTSSGCLRRGGNGAQTQFACELCQKNLRPPLIGQTFPIEILIENKSEGEALDLNIEIEFPDNLKVMRGTLKKQIYSLRSNENIKWEINLKPLEAGDYSIKIKALFKDPDQNQIGETKDFPLSIKL